MDLLSQLNDSQRLAVEYIDGPSLVIAGAGSGKTRVLTYKVAYLLQHGLRPWNILALTFTNKAAREMKERIANLVGEDMSKGLYMGTFHSIFARILRRDASRIGFNSNFTIYDETDSRSLIKSIVKEMKLDDKQYKPADVHRVISSAKNRLIDANAYANNKEALKVDYQRRQASLYKIYIEYERRCMIANAMDFDDLLLNTYRLFLNNEDVRQHYAQMFEFVLVDEYQDTNYAQQVIMMQLVRERQRVCVVGDDAQSIYAFRGAEIENILKFQEQLHDVKLFKLERNYRSTPQIVNTANSLIKHNERQIHKDVFSDNEEGQAVEYMPTYSEQDEAAAVCKKIKEIIKKDKLSYDDFAVLYRTNAQSRTFEDMMRKVSIPYRIYGGVSFYQRKEIKDVLAYMRLVANPDDEEALKRIINYPTRGIGDTTVAKLLDTARKANCSAWTILSEMEKYDIGVNKGTASKLMLFQQMIQIFINDSKTMHVDDLGEKIVNITGMAKDLYNSHNPDDIARRENIEELLAGMTMFVDEQTEQGLGDAVFVDDYLQQVALLTDLDSDKDDTEKVKLMTIHAAKGLEFPVVFVVGLEENLFPSVMSIDSKKNIEEERRLLYVAITRAEKYCFLTNAKNRVRYGKMEFNSPSRFLHDIDQRLLVCAGKRMDGDNGRKPLRNSNDTKNRRIQNSRPVASQFMADEKPKITHGSIPEEAVNPFSDDFMNMLRQRGADTQRIEQNITKGGRMITPKPSDTPIITTAPSRSNNDYDSPTLSEGDTIEHQRFGRGTVISIEGMGENTKATVDFQNVGTKQLLLRFAKYRKV